MNRSNLCSFPLILRTSTKCGALMLMLVAVRAWGQEAPAIWPTFLGQGASALDASSLPTSWSPTSNIAWQTKLTGAGQSSPVIWGDKVFVTSIDGEMKNDCLITGLSLADGKILWSYKTPSSQPVRGNYFQSRSAPTPSVDAERVYAFFETGKLVAVSHDGKLAWERSLTEEYGEFEVRIGLAASVAQTDGTVFVLVDHEGPSYLLAVDKKTGETLWKTERFSRQSYASPTLLTIGGRQQVVCSSGGSIDGYDPTTGEQLWTFEEVDGNRACTPQAWGDGRFVIGASPGMHNEHLAGARESNFLMQVEVTDDGFEPKVLWRTKKAMPSFGSPMIYQGLAYWITGSGVLYCFDASTGERVYMKRCGQPCWTTPLGLGDHIYLFGKDGLTTVIATGREFRVLAENELFDGAIEAGEADLNRREEGMHGNADSTADGSTEASGKQAVRGRGERSGGGERPTTRDGLTFAEKVQYGYAAVNGSLIVRTGSILYCLRALEDFQSTTASGAQE